MTAAAIPAPAPRAPAKPSRRLPPWTPPLGTLSPTARRTLVIMLAGPLESRPRGWCKTGDTQVVAPSAVMGKLGAEGLVAVGYVGTRLRSRLTPRGQTWARAAAAREADLLMAGALAGYDWLQERATKEAAAVGGVGVEASP